MAVTEINHVIYRSQHHSRVKLVVVSVYTLVPYIRATWNKYFEKLARNSEGRRVACQWCTITPQGFSISPFPYQILDCPQMCGWPEYSRVSIPEQNCGVQ
jgi:hypothetical protein